MGFNQTHRLARAASWQDCICVFNTPEPRGWLSSTRPLGSARQPHYRIEKAYKPMPDADYGDNTECFRVFLYNTEMARHYAPDEMGTCVSLYDNDDRVTSQGFMRHVLRVSRVTSYPFAIPLSDTPMYVPIKSGSLFDTVITRDALGQVLRDKSCHAQAYSIKRSDGADEWCVYQRKRLKPVFDALSLTLPDLIAQHTPGFDARPFKGHDRFTKSHAFAVLSREVEDAVEPLRELYKACLAFVLEVRAGRDIEQPPTHAIVVRSVMGVIYSQAPRGRKYAPLPMFAPLPKAWTFYSS